MNRMDHLLADVTIASFTPTYNAASRITAETDNINGQKLLLIVILFLGYCLLYTHMKYVLNREVSNEEKNNCYCSSVRDGVIITCFSTGTRVGS